jgi:hypothetical protein
MDMTERFFTGMTAAGLAILAMGCVWLMFVS